MPSITPPSMETSSSWGIFCASLAEIFSRISFRNLQQKELSPTDGFALWVRLTLEMKQQGGCLYFVGNGASSSMSSHFAADLNKNARIRTQIFTDASLLTAVGNDISFDQIFAEPLRRQGKPGDMLLTISSSGNSPNILAAIVTARERGLGVVTLSGMKPANSSRCLGDLNIYAPAHTYGLAETAHSAVLHYWTDRITAATGPEVDG